MLDLITHIIYLNNVVKYNGWSQGIRIIYYSGDKIIGKVFQCYNGQRYGFAINYYPTNQIELITHWYNNARHGAVIRYCFDGRTIKANAASALRITRACRVAWLNHFFHGKLHGISISYYYDDPDEITYWQRGEKIIQFVCYNARRKPLFYQGKNNLIHLSK